MGAERQEGRRAAHFFRAEGRRVTGLACWHAVPLAAPLAAATTSLFLSSISLHACAEMPCHSFRSLLLLFSLCLCSIFSHKYLCFMCRVLLTKLVAMGWPHLQGMPYNTS